MVTVDVEALCTAFEGPADDDISLSQMYTTLLRCTRTDAPPILICDIATAWLGTKSQVDDPFFRSAIDACIGCLLLKGLQRAQARGEVISEEQLVNAKECIRRHWAAAVANPVCDPVSVISVFHELS